MMSILQVYLNEIPTEKTKLLHLKAGNAPAGNENRVPAVFFKKNKQNNTENRTIEKHRNAPKKGGNGWESNHKYVVPGPHSRSCFSPSKH